MNERFWSASLGDFCAKGFRPYCIHPSAKSQPTSHPLLLAPSSGSMDDNSRWRRGYYHWVSNSFQAANTRTLHGSALRWILSVAQSLIHEHPLLACAPRSLSTTMPWEHHFISVVISLWLVPLGVYSFQVADTRTLHGSALRRTLSVA